MCRNFLSRLQLEVSTYEVTMQKCIWECFHWCLLMHSNTLYYFSYGWAAIGAHLYIPAQSYLGVGGRGRSECFLPMCQ